MDKFKLQIPTTIFFGRNEFARISRLAKQVGKKAFIVTGQGSVKKNGYLQRLEAYLNDAGVQYTIFEGIEPNPRSDTINKAGKLAEKAGSDMIIALGGGSVMDASKGISVVAKSGNDIWDYCILKNKVPKKVIDALPIICIPTLAATGSEVNAASVITNIKTKQKSVLFSTKTIPKFAIIDPILTLSVPANYLVDGAVDIICHCIESYISCKDNNYIPDFITFSIIRTVKICIEKLLKDNEDINARENLSWASSLAMTGVLSGRNGGWPIHEIEHGISGLYDISHGLGLTMLIPSMLKFNSHYIEKRICRLLGFFFHENTSFYSDSSKAINNLEDWLKNIGAKRNLKDLGIENIDIEAVADNTLGIYANSRNEISGVVPIKRDDIITILKDAFN